MLTLPRRILLVLVLFTNANCVYSQELMDPCTFLSQVLQGRNGEGQVQEFLANVREAIATLIKEDYFQRLSESEAGVYFTNSVGYYRTLDCSERDENRRLPPAGMFGVGDLFKPIMKREFHGDIYFFGTTRSGLNLLVRKVDLQKMEEDQVYFFNNTETPAYFCTNTTECTGSAKEFTARHHYASASSRNIPTNPAAECSNVPVSVFQRTGRSSSSGNWEQIFPQGGTLIEYCPPTSQTASKNGIIARSKGDSEMIFDALSVRGTFFLFSVEELTKNIPSLFTRKDCGSSRSIRKSAVTTLGGSLKLFVLDVGGEAKFDFSEEEVFAANKQYLFLNYTANPRDKSLFGAADKLVRDIQIEHDCSGSFPSDESQMVMHVSPESREMIKLDLSVVEHNAHNAVTGVWGLPPHGNALGASSSGRLKGRAWYICGLNQYMRWQHLSFDIIYRELEGIFAKRLPEVPEEARLDYTHYFTSLFMAVAFEYIPEGQCDSVSKFVRR